MKHRDVKRIALVIPAGNLALEYEFPRYLPEGVAINVSRMYRPGGAVLTAESLLVMRQEIERAVRDLDRVYPAAVLFGCTSGSFVGGDGDEAELARRIGQLSGAPAVTTARAVIDALRHLSARRVFMLTPYPEDINRQEVAFLARHGIAVDGYDAFACDAGRPIADIDSEEIVARLEQHQATIRRTDAVFISCTNLLTLDNIERLERRFARPVVSSNLASLWAVARLVGLAPRGMGCGTLFSRSPQ